MEPPRRGKIYKKTCEFSFCIFHFAFIFMLCNIFWMKEKRDVKKLRKEREKPKSLKC